MELNYHGTKFFARIGGKSRFFESACFSAHRIGTTQ